jgi:excisionase family DNA binding protein
MNRSVTDSEAHFLDSKVLVSVEAAAEMLSLGRTMVYGLVMSNDLRSIKVGRCRRILVSSLHEYVARRSGELN